MSCVCEIAGRGSLTIGFTRMVTNSRTHLILKKIKGTAGSPFLTRQPFGAGGKSYFTWQVRHMPEATPPADTVCAVRSRRVPAIDSWS